MHQHSTHATRGKRRQAKASDQGNLELLPDHPNPLEDAYEQLRATSAAVIEFERSSRVLHKVALTCLITAAKRTFQHFEQAMDREREWEKATNPDKSFSPRKVWPSVYADADRPRLEILWKVRAGKLLYPIALASGKQRKYRWRVLARPKGAFLYSSTLLTSYAINLDRELILETERRFGAIRAKWAALNQRKRSEDRMLQNFYATADRLVVEVQRERKRKDPRRQGRAAANPVEGELDLT